MSHVKNVEAFGKLIGICTGLGEHYTPGQPNLSIPALTGMLSNARLLLGTVQEGVKDLAAATNAREIAFENMRKLAMRVINELKSCGVPEQTLADARAVTRKLAGYRISRDPIPAEAGNAKDKTRRARGSDFITQVESFNMLIRYVSNEPKYTPVREELKLASLQTVANALLQHNEVVIQVYAQLSNTRRMRNDFLYRVEGSIAVTVRAVKHHIRGTFDLNSDAYKTVSKILVNVPSRM